MANRGQYSVMVSMRHKPVLHQNHSFLTLGYVLKIKHAFSIENLSTPQCMPPGLVKTIRCGEKMCVIE